MPTLTEDIDLPGGVDPATVTATVQLWGAGDAVGGFDLAASKSIGGVRYATTGNPWSITGIVGNEALLPAGTVYRVVRKWPGLKKPLVDFILMPLSGGPYTVGSLLAEQPASVASAALGLHAADTDLHGGGIELAYAGKSDADFTSTATNGADVPGLSITFEVPNRAYGVAMCASCTIEEANQWGALLLVDSGGNPIGAPQPTFGKASAGFLGASNFQTETRIPNAMHAPAPGTTVTYKVLATTSVATSDFTVKTQLFGPSNVAHIRAWTL